MHELQRDAHTLGVKLVDDLDSRLAEPSSLFIPFGNNRAGDGIDDVMGAAALDSG